jgi:hypothetical protein
MKRAPHAVSARRPSGPFALGADNRLNVFDEMTDRRAPGHFRLIRQAGRLRHRSLLSYDGQRRRGSGFIAALLGWLPVQYSIETRVPQRDVTA